MAAIIRQAEKRDLESLCHLVHAFHEFHVAGLSLRLASLGDLNVFDSTELTERPTQIFEDSEAAVFVAELDGQLVGFVEIYLRQDDPNPVVVSYKYGYLQSLMVSQNHRSDGYGKQLVHAAEHWAKAKGAEEIRLETWEFLAGPLKFYEKSGYRTLKRTLVKDI